MSALEDARTALAEYDALGIGSSDAAGVLRALIADHERLTAEMHQRELHHFETEKLLTEAGIDPDAPPTDDEREALEDWSFEHRPILSMKDGSIASCKCMDRVFINGQEDWDSHIAASLIAAGFRRPGPITDEWEYEVTYSGYRNPTTDGFRIRSSSGMLSTLESAQEWAAQVPNPMIRRRTKAVEAGPWEPVEAARDAS